MTGRGHQRRYNVAASRAKDQLWLFTSIPANATFPDRDMRPALLSYMRNPPQALRFNANLDDSTTTDLRAPFDTMLEQQIYLRLRKAGYAVIAHHPIKDRHIDLVVVGNRGQLAVHCHAPHPDVGHKELHEEFRFQQDLTRAGWQFVRIRDSEYQFDPATALEPLWTALTKRGIEPRPLPTTAPRTAEWRPPILSDRDDDESITPST
jgi:REase_MTES_1575